MELTEEQGIKLERYLGGEMSRRERIAFEAEMRSVPGGEKLLREHKLAQEALAEVALSQQMRRVQAMPDVSEDQGWQRQRAWISAGRWALLASAVALLVWRFLPGPEAALFDEYYRPPLRLAGNSLSGAAEVPGIRGLLALPMDAYGQGDYRAALKGLEALEAAYAGNDTLQFYMAACHLALGEPEKALGLLEPLAAKPGPYTQDARWYAALGSLKLGRRPAARDWLRRIEAGSAWSESARVLEKKLK